MNRLFVAARALVWATLFISLWTWVALRARDLDVAAGRSLPFVVVWPGVVLASLGALIVLACVVTFVVAGDGTPAPFDPPRRFVAVGPYRWVRNPMYLGALSVLAGAGLAFRTPAVVVLAAVAWIGIHLFVVLGEEPGLVKRFGESYEAYRRTTNRWLPRAART